MRFQLNITVTEDDYIAFNLFHSLDTAEGKRGVLKSRIIFLSLFVAIVVVLMFILRPTWFSTLYCLLLGIWTFYRLFCVRHIISRNIKKHIEKIKKVGKVPFVPNATLEFYEDRLVEITETTRTECQYRAIEKICVVNDQHIFLYNSAASAFIISIPQIRAQVNPTDLLRFLSEKCATIEYC